MLVSRQPSLCPLSVTKFQFPSQTRPKLACTGGPHWRDVRCLTGRAGSLKVTPTPLLCQWENVRQFIWNLNKEQRTDYFICCSLFMKLISTRALVSVALRSYFEQNEAVSRLLWTRSRNLTVGRLLLSHSSNRQLISNISDRLSRHRHHDVQFGAAEGASRVPETDPVVHCYAGLRYLLWLLREVWLHSLLPRQQHVLFQHHGILPFQVSSSSGQGFIHFISSSWWWYQKLVS